MDKFQTTSAFGRVYDDLGGADRTAGNQTVSELPNPVPPAEGRWNLKSMTTLSLGSGRVLLIWGWQAV